MIEVWSAGRWQPLGGERAPQVNESDLFRLRGLAPGARLDIGGAKEVTADPGGGAGVRLKDCPEIRGHLGLVALAVDGVPVGEVDVRPDKLSSAAYATLRAELESEWTGLVLDPSGGSALMAGPPPALELWRRVEAPLQSILTNPQEVLADSVEYLRAERARRPRELTPAVLRAQQTGRTALARTLARSLDTPDNRMVVDTLHRLRTLALRTGDPVVASVTQRCLVSEPLRGLGRHRARHGYSVDTRYRRVQQVRQLLMIPELDPVEGPGELRLGVQAIDRLYEYWVFLRVLLQAQRRYGPPLAPGFEVLRVPTTRGVRLEIPVGATVSFPGDVHVAFEPVFQENPAGSWMGVEYVRNPLRELEQRVATPDVVVLRAGSSPAMLVVDAKYVGRHWVEQAAVRVHAKYARMRLSGKPVVSEVVAVHPHATFQSQAWPGYRHLAMAPDGLVATLPLPVPYEPVRPAAVPGHRAGQLHLVVDQGWMRDVLGQRRLDLREVRQQLGGERTASATVVMPALGGLASFARACERAGWSVHRVPSTSRPEVVAELATLLAELHDGEVVLVSGADDAVTAARAATTLPLLVVDQVEVFVDTRAER